MATTMILFLAAFLTSILSGTIGMGGGILLFAVMAQYFPLSVLVPLHGLIQLGSNGSRVVYSYRSVDLRIAIQFALGAMVGAWVGSKFVIQVPEDWYKMGLGLFILGITFLPLPKPKKPFRFKWPLIGGIATFLGLFVGATGPLIAPYYLSEHLKKETLVATKAACQVCGHFFKVITFFALGFVIGPHLFLLLGMLIMVFLGNYIGKLLLHRMREVWFLWVFRGFIVILSVRMIVQGFLL